MHYSPKVQYSTAATDITIYFSNTVEAFNVVFLVESGKAMVRSIGVFMISRNQLHI
jgi:hypothetical protein